MDDKVNSSEDLVLDMKSAENGRGSHCDTCGKPYFLDLSSEKGQGNTQVYTSSKKKICMCRPAPSALRCVCARCQVNPGVTHVVTGAGEMSSSCLSCLKGVNVLSYRWDHIKKALPEVAGEDACKVTPCKDCGFQGAPGPFTDATGALRAPLNRNQRYWIDHLCVQDMGEIPLLRNYYIIGKRTVVVPMTRTKAVFACVPVLFLSFLLVVLKLPLYLITLAGIVMNGNYGVELASFFYNRWWLLGKLLGFLVATITAVIAVPWLIMTAVMYIVTNLLTSPLAWLVKLIVPWSVKRLWLFMEARYRVPQVALYAPSMKRSWWLGFTIRALEWHVDFVKGDFASRMEDKAAFSSGDRLLAMALATSACGDFLTELRKSSVSVQKLQPRWLPDKMRGDYHESLMGSTIPVSHLSGAMLMHSECSKTVLAALGGTGLVDVCLVRRLSPQEREAWGEDGDTSQEQQQQRESEEVVELVAGSALEPNDLKWVRVESVSKCRYKLV